MKDVLNIKQYEKLRFALKWHADWDKAFRTNPQGMTDEDMADHEEVMEWYAHMAVKECDDAGLDAELLFNSTLIGQAWEYKNKVSPRQIKWHGKN